MHMYARRYVNVYMHMCDKSNGNFCVPMYTFMCMGKCVCNLSVTVYTHAGIQSYLPDACSRLNTHRHVTATGAYTHVHAANARARRHFCRRVLVDGPQQKTCHSTGEWRARAL